MRPFIVIERVRHRDGEEHGAKMRHEKSIVHHQSSEDIGHMLESAKGYSEYIEKYGHHFSDALAEHVSRAMVNANGKEHSWTAMQIKQSMENLHLSIPTTVTTGDVTYLANMYYADLFPECLKDEVACLKAAYALANDPDGYDGMVFRRWTADVLGKEMNVDWSKFI